MTSGGQAADDRTQRLLEAGMALSAELSLPSLLQRLVEIAAELTDARFGALGVLSPDGDRLVDFVTTGVSPEERRAIGDLPSGRGILGVLISDPRPLRLRDIAADPRTSGFPPNHPPMRTFLGAPVRAHGRVFGNIYLTEKRERAEFTEDDEASATVLATQAGVAIANARLYEETRLRERWLEAVRETSTAILAGATPDSVLSLVARRARELVGADSATIVTRDGDAATMRVAVADGMHAERLVGVHVPLDGSVSGEVIRSGHPSLVDDASRDPRAYQPLIAMGEMGPMITVPLRLRQEVTGTLSVANLVGRPRFHPGQLSLLETFADQAALGLEYSRAQRELSRLALVEDRERIAKELHDGVIQALFAVGLGLQATSAMAGDARLAERLQDAVNEVDRVIGDLRSYIFGLRPAVLSDGDLSSALQQLAHEFESRSGVTTVVDVDPSVESVVGDRGAHLIQLTREALSNVVRHAQAKTCRISLRRGDSAVLLEIDDDGRGFDPTMTVAGGMGLGNMRTRAESIGGAFRVDSSAGIGTTIRVTLPL